MAVLPVTDLNTPVEAGEFAALMAAHGPWPDDCPSSPVAVAVSGGGDSMALALLAAQWRRAITAFVVDHGLRAESAEEVRLTRDRLEARGIAVQVLTLTGLSRTRLQERARDARFDSLLKACRIGGYADLLVAHHQADQEETIWMRFDAGSGMAGLSGIPSQSIREGVRITRPLLRMGPERLQATLRHHRQCWIDDPSNRNRAFERVRWRQDMTDAQRYDAHRMRADGIKMRLAQDAILTDMLAEYVQWHPLGWVSVSSEGVHPSVLAAVIRLVGNGRYLPARESVQRVVSKGYGTLGGTVIRPAGRWGDGVVVLREERACQGAVEAEPGIIWDGRWQYKGQASGLIAPLGDGVLQLKARRYDCPAAVLRTLPALWQGSVLAGVPTLLPDIGTVAFSWGGRAPVTGASAFQMEKHY